MNKPLVAVLVSLIALGTVNFVMAAAPGSIQNVFVTNFPRNENVTVTNPPTVTTNVTVSFPGAQPKVLVLAENRSLAGGSTDTYTFSVRGYAWWSVTFAETGTSSQTTYSISLKNGPAVALYTVTSWGTTGSVYYPAYFSDEIVLTISNPSSMVYSLGVALSFGQ